jgi:uncharacterized protein YmfQ (DUF2313 family)
MFEAIGLEYDDIEEWAQTVRYEAYPQTCTWSIGIWEWVYGIDTDDTLPLDFRRGRIMSKRLQHPPINPARIEAILTALTGVPVTVIENTGPYMFEVILDESQLSAANLTQMYRVLRQIKPSHLSFTASSYIKMEFEVTDYFAEVISEYFKIFYTEEASTKNDAVDYSAAAYNEIVKEVYTE